ncbi:MAG: hypothetical protein KDB21_03045 [Acidimicrobiales bacterium]|nr:hypothetical protein [Acidimicrobiales bacterium]
MAPHSDGWRRRGRTRALLVVLLMAVGCSGETLTVEADPTTVPTESPPDASPEPTETAVDEPTMDGFALDLPDGADPEDYVEVVDDTGELWMEVPVSWNDVDTRPVVTDGGTELASVFAATDLDEIESHRASGIRTLLLTAEAGPVSEQLDAAATEARLAGLCANVERADGYDDDVYTGVRELWTGCGAGGSAVYLLAAGASRGDGRIVVIEATLTTSGDAAAVEHVLETFYHLGADPNDEVTVALGEVDVTLPRSDVVDEFVELIDDTGVLTADAPQRWDRVDTSPSELDDGALAPSILAVEREGGLYDGPSVSLTLFPAQLGTATVDEALDALDATSGVSEDCTEVVRVPYDDGVYNGMLGVWTGCPSGAVVGHLVAIPADGDEGVVTVQLVMFDAADVTAGDRVLATFVHDGATTGNRESVAIGDHRFTLPVGEDPTAVMEISDDTRVVFAEVPASWTDVDGSTRTVEGVSAPSVVAGPDLPGFIETYDEPGVRLTVYSGSLADQPSAAILDSLAESANAADACYESFRDYTYEDAAYVGDWEVFTGCSSSGVALFHLVALPKDPILDGTLLVLEAQMVTTGDMTAVAHVLDTFVHGPLGGPAPTTAPAPAGNAQQAIDRVSAHLAGCGMDWEDPIAVDMGAGLWEVSVFILPSSDRGDPGEGIYWVDVSDGSITSINGTANVLCPG